MDAYDAIITRTGAGALERGDGLLRELPPAAACLPEERDPEGRVCASGLHLTIRQGSAHVGAEQ